MHRSRLSLLAIVTASACSTRGDAKSTEILSKDPSLAAGLRDNQKAQQLPLPDVCGSIGPVAQPSVASRRQAQELTRQAYAAELVGNANSARSLLIRAAQLDATDRSAAYHLGRTSEALGDRGSATKAYCRYIALTPTSSESAEARQRLAELAQREVSVSAGAVSNTAPTRRAAPVRARLVTHARATVPQQVAVGTVESAGGAVDDSSMPTDGVSSSSSVEQSATPAPVVRRGPSRMQSAGIGAIAGAIMGAAVGRSVKSAVIGAAAGGVLGTVVGGAPRPLGGGLRPWATTSQPPVRTRWARLSGRGAGAS